MEPNVIFSCKTNNVFGESKKPSPVKIPTLNPSFVLTKGGLPNIKIHSGTKKVNLFCVDYLFWYRVLSFADNGNGNEVSKWLCRAFIWTPL